MNTLLRMMELSYQGYYCSQILLILALEAQGKRDPDLVRSMAGLANGGGAELGTCGTLAGGACLLALYAGKGADGETESPTLASMLRELREWFELRIGEQYGGITCGEIVGDGSQKKKRCGAVVADTYAKAREILASHGVDLTRGAHG